MAWPDGDKPSQNHPTQPFAVAPTSDRFGEMMQLRRTATMGAERGKQVWPQAEWQL
jgi:hypothetical protein